MAVPQRRDNETAGRAAGLRYAALGGCLFVLLTLLSVYAWRVDHATWEMQLIQILQRDGPPGLRPLSIGLAVAGTGLPWALLISLLGLCLLVLAGLRTALLLLLVAVLQDVGAAIKMLVERARPTDGAVAVWRQIDSYSFPSGHVLGATLVFGFLIAALERTTLHVPVRRALQGACAAWILLMGLGRMELGAHWPTDVLGAYLVGALLLLPVIAMLRRLQPAANASVEC